MFWSKNKKKVYPCKPQFYYIKVGCKGVFVTRTCFHDETLKFVFICYVSLNGFFSCSQDSDILGGDFDSIENSIPLINRYYVNLYVFKFYNSDDVFFKCTVKLCPSGSSACDIVSNYCLTNQHVV